MGGRKRDFVQFRIVWPPQNQLATGSLLQRPPGRKVHPNAAETILDSSLDTKRYPTRFVPTSGLIAYRPVSRLGYGASGEVWKAIGSRHGSVFAVKILQLRSSNVGEVAWWMDTALREFSILQTLDHPHVVACFHGQGFNNDSDKIELFMDLYDTTTWDLIGSRPDLSESIDFLKMFVKDTLRGLAYVHHKGVIHRDIKPENILVKRGDGREWHFSLADFGVSKLLDHKTTFSGTVPYMAPEVHNHHLQTTAADIFSFGRTVLVIHKPKLLTDALRKDSLKEFTDARFVEALKTLQTVAPLLQHVPSKRPPAQAFYLESFGHCSEIASLHPKELRTVPERSLVGGFNLTPVVDAHGMRMQH
ncbi:hypothetical protein FH972_024038 [Carpinus fangiana]|uniref:non-specific serine/threonine protein kinase n=1 Tax=Carpinus fangiana TaxID=176857 RepID=A0A5N6KX89_9ROSI|nr:hypothetical protein FH972_024038 [Carpinus fangiana]